MILRTEFTLRRYLLGGIRKLEFAVSISENPSFLSRDFRSIPQMRLILLCCVIATLFSGCVTNEQGKKEFNPVKAANKADESFDEWWYSS